MKFNSVSKHILKKKLNKKNIKVLLLKINNKRSKFKIWKKLKIHNNAFNLIHKNKMFKKFFKKNNLKKYNEINFFNLKNNIQLKSYIFIFIRKLFNSFIKKGKKLRVINYFLKLMFFIFMKIFKSKKCKNKTKFFLLYFNQILNNIIPIFIYTNLMFRGKNVLMPWINKNVKLNKIKVLKICVSWTKNSIYKRKEKTFFLKILSELEDARLNRGETILNKKNYYLQFYKNKHYIRFLKKRSWI